MAVLEQQDVLQQVSADVSEAQRHNEKIKERYYQLQNDLAGQFSEEKQTAMQETTRVEARTPATSLYISPVNVGNAAVLEQTPQVTEYVSPAAATALFTTEKFDRMTAGETMVAPMPVQAVEPMRVTAMAVEAQYSLTPLAKVVMAVFACVIVAMLSLICANTYLINQKSVRIKNLEQKKEQLMEQSEELQRRIEEARSEETIRQFAESQGMLWVGN